VELRRETTELTELSFPKSKRPASSLSLPSRIPGQQVGVVRSVSKLVPTVPSCTSRKVLHDNDGRTGADKCGENHVLCGAITVPEDTVLTKRQLRDKFHAGKRGPVSLSVSGDNGDSVSEFDPPVSGDSGLLANTHFPDGQPSYFRILVAIPRRSAPPRLVARELRCRTSQRSSPTGGRFPPDSEDRSSRQQP